MERGFVLCVLLVDKIRFKIVIEFEIYIENGEKMLFILEATG